MAHLALAVLEVSIDIMTVLEEVYRLFVFANDGLEVILLITHKRLCLERIILEVDVVWKFRIHEVAMPFLGHEVGPHYQVFAVDVASTGVGGFHLLGPAIVEHQVKSYFQVVLLGICVIDGGQPGRNIGTAIQRFDQGTDVLSEHLDS